MAATTEGKASKEAVSVKLVGAVNPKLVDYSGDKYISSKNGGGRVWVGDKGAPWLVLATDLCLL